MDNIAINSIDLFVTHWSTKHTMVPIANDDIVELEQKLSAFLPQSYKYLLTTYGLVHSPNVLTTLCDLNVEIADVQDFLSLDDVFSLSQLYQMSGMPKGYAVFASDVKGNMFCFKLSDCQQQQNDIGVWFYDYGLCTVNKVSDSFGEWLAQFNRFVD